jgi:hypothetical protein
MTASGPAEVVAALKRIGVSLAAYLPDEWLEPLIAEVERPPGLQGVRVAREDEGIGICAGAFFGGKRAQNDFCDAEGAIHRAYALDISAGEAILPRPCALIDAAHSAHVPVVYTRRVNDATTESPAFRGPRLVDGLEAWR